MKPMLKGIILGFLLKEKIQEIFTGVVFNGLNLFHGIKNRLSKQEELPNNSLIKNNIRVNINPNPFYNYITIDGLNNKSCIIELYDIFGRIVYNSICRESSITIGMIDIESGIYFIRIQEEN